MAYVDGVAKAVEIPEKLLSTGPLGELLAFRSQELNQTRNALGQPTLIFVDAFNTQYKKGFDASSDQGKDFLTIGSPEVFNNAGDTGTGSLSAKIIDSFAVQATDYKIVFGGRDWQVIRLVGNTSFRATVTGGRMSFDGMETIANAGVKTNDSFTVKSASNAIVGMKVMVTDESKIAMAQVSRNDTDPTINKGKNDSRNGQKLLDLRAKATVDNRISNGAYVTLVSDVGNKTTALKTSTTIQNNVVTQLYRQRQPISGVDLDEEYGNLQCFQQYHLVNAQVLQTVNALSDILINIR